jgi:hypothetical protein
MGIIYVLSINGHIDSAYRKRERAIDAMIDEIRLTGDEVPDRKLIETELNLNSECVILGSSQIVLDEVNVLA